MVLVEKLVWVGGGEGGLWLVDKGLGEGVGESGGVHLLGDERIRAM